MPSKGRARSIDCWHVSGWATDFFGFSSGLPVTYSLSPPSHSDTPPGLTAQYKAREVIQDDPSCGSQGGPGRGQSSEHLWHSFLHPSPFYSCPTTGSRTTKKWGKGIWRGKESSRGAAGRPVSPARPQGGTPASFIHTLVITKHVWM